MGDRPGETCRGSDASGHRETALPRAAALLGAPGPWERQENTGGCAHKETPRLPLLLSWHRLQDSGFSGQIFRFSVSGQGGIVLK